jgi:hypothetical protein
MIKIKNCPALSPDQFHGLSTEQLDIIIEFKLFSCPYKCILSMCFFFKPARLAAIDKVTILHIFLCT